jgi:hypothetical protein
MDTEAKIKIHAQMMLEEKNWKDRVIKLYSLARTWISASLGCKTEPCELRLENIGPIWTDLGPGKNGTGGTIRGFGPDGDIKTAGPEFMTASEGAGLIRSIIVVRPSSRSNEPRFWRITPCLIALCWRFLRVVESLTFPRSLNCVESWDSNAPARSTRSCLVECMFSASDAAVGSPCCAETESGWFSWFWLPPTWAICVVLGSLLPTVCAAKENGGKSSKNKLHNWFY